MRVKTAAKINLALDVTGKLPNGYHTIESVFQTVGLYDEVSVELTESGIELGCEVPEEFASADPIPCDERNIAYKAAKLFFEENGMDCGCRIHIKKGIPSQAGMGGGSTDAAAVLYCLGELTGKSVSAPEKLGADVPGHRRGNKAYRRLFGTYPCYRQGRRGSFYRRGLQKHRRARSSAPPRRKGSCGDYRQRSRQSLRALWQSL